MGDNEIKIIIGLVIFALALIIYFFYMKIRKEVENSDRIIDLKKLNESINFHELKPIIRLKRHYDNKGNYNRIQPEYLMGAEIRDNLSYYEKVFNEIKENKKKLNLYKEQVYHLSNNEYDCFSNKGALLSIYKKIEKNIFDKNILRPIVDIQFLVVMTYSSPKGQVNLSKSSTFTLNDMISTYDSVSRTYLERDFYDMISLVERGKVSDSMRYDVFKRDNFRCVICGASSKHGVRLHVDHIIPIAKGGKSTMDNLQTLCERCNVGKSDKI